MIATLNDNFALPGQLEFSEGPGGLTVAKVKTAQAEAMISLSGGHVMSWQPNGQSQPVIWLSQFAKFAPGKSIRGGVPICWPWFGPHSSEASYPGHGFARTVPWQVENSKAMDDGSVQIRLRLQPNEATQAQWPYPSNAEMTIRVGRELTLELTTVNLCRQALTLTEALHTYFAVSDIRNTPILGLDGCHYMDKVDGGARKQQNGAINIDGEVDRVYVDTNADCIIDDRGWQRKIRIRKENSQSTIVWNPGLEKADKMGDFGPEGHLGMVCVESGNALENAVEIPAGGDHVLKVVYSVE